MPPGMSLSARVHVSSERPRERTDGKKEPKVHHRSVDRIVARAMLPVYNWCFPFTPSFLLYFSILLAATQCVGWGPAAWAGGVVSRLCLLAGVSSVLAVVLSVLLPLPLFILSTVYTARFAFRALLSYTGWLFESPGKPPRLATKIFIVIVQFVNKYALYFSYQNVLPSMPLPNVDETIAKFLETAEPLMSEEEHADLTEKADEFKKTLADKIQWKLRMKWLISDNYLADWWKEVVYMRYRDSLIRTNVGCADIIYGQTTTNQAARAAYVTLNRQHFCRDLYKKQTMRPISMGGIPLCAQQYTEYHRTLRVPHETADKTARLDDARHIAVYHKGCWYQVPMYHGRRLVRAPELERALQSILDTPATPQPGERLLSSLTAGPRDLWAKIRSQKFAQGVNHASLKMIEDALEIVFMDDEERHYDVNDTSKYDREYSRALHGDGYQLWCDKPSVYFFSKNGRFTSNAEHSPVDAMIYVHVREYIKYHEAFDHPYGTDGHCVGEVEHVPSPSRLEWQMDDETLSAIDEAYAFSSAIARDFDNSNVVFDDFGKDFIKKARVSPDAFIQMALQMAYYKDQGKFELTYEPAVMRLFVNGRTETVRSCSNQSAAFVKAMLDDTKADAERLKLLGAACTRHQDYTRQAMAGRGVDRHLFGMYVVSKYYQWSSPFLDAVFSQNYALSTSQTPQHQMEEYMKALNGQSDLFWPAGGFTCPDGSNYGVCYTISASGDRLSFHISAWKSNDKTNAYRFRDTITSCLREMRRMVESATEKK